MISITAATAVQVFGRAIQQMNVTGGHYLAAAATPFLIAIGDVAVVLLAVEGGWASIPWVGAGGAVGAVSAMWLHRAVTRQKKSRARRERG